MTPMARLSDHLLRGLMALLVLALAHPRAGAQTATNACGYNAGNQYPVGSSCSFSTFNKPDGFTGTYTASGCSGDDSDDAWGWFTATGTTTNITFDPANNHRPIMHIYTGTCTAGLSQVACDNAGSTGNNAQITNLATVPGQNYMIRIQRHNDDGAMNGSICIWSPAPPANDAPCNATALTVGVACSTVAATVVSSTPNAGIPAPGCANFGGNDVWFTFVAPATGEIRIETTAGSLSNSGMALYSATACNGIFTLIECDADDGPGSMSEIVRTGLNPGQTYYVRMWGEGTSMGTFNICAYAPPAYDEPCGATPLTLGSTCTYTSYTNAGTTASAGIPAPGCGGYSGGDMWFSFVAPPSALASFRTTAGSLTNVGMAVYSATACNGTFTLVSCDNTSGPGNMPFISLTPLELVPGQTYYLRVWNNGGGTGTFNLCATAPPAGGTCSYALQMYDSQGNGWGGSFVSIQVGAGAPVNYTITDGDRETAYITVNIGQTIQLSYTSIGGNQGEIRYVLQLGYGAAFAEGPTPGTGLRYTTIATCQSAAPSTSDCYGRTPICGAQQISDNPTNTGLTSELNQHNRGCLGSNERQGSWYSFTIANGGTLAFTIAPTNSADDYDFAVWGPFSSMSCPPIGAPLRCNYSGTTGNTGLSTTASNPSEPAGGAKWSTAITVTTGQMYLLYISNFSQSGLAFNLSWQLTNGASIDCNILPVELLSFEGQAAGSMVDLTWATASESGSSHFEVERLDLDGNYATIGTVAAVGESTTTTHYALVDAAPLPGTNYYRLKLVDVDGTTTTSNIVEVRASHGTSAITVFPNPTEGDLNLSVNVQREGLHTVRVLDASGRIVFDQQQAFTLGEQPFRTSLAHLSAAPYELLVLGPDGAPLHNGRFIKQ